jgi:hypothetical protein
MTGICDHWSVDPPENHFNPPNLPCERPRLFFELLTLLNFDFNADPDPALHSNADPDQFPNKCGSGSAILALVANTVTIPDPAFT